ncbi:MAG: hypothetical protein ACFFB5_02165 [Promethearchaeota archaeon]
MLKRINNDLFLKLSFLIGGLYNISMVILLLFFGEFFSSYVEVQKPELIFIQFTALFLIIVGYFLVYAAQNPQKLVIIGFGSVVTRLGYFSIVILTLISQGLEIVYLLFGLIDAIIALIILIPLILTEGVSWRQLWHF